MSTKTLTVSCSTAPGNSETVIALDSTYGLMGSQASMHASTGAYLTPGRYRSKWDHAIVKVIAECATQNVTVLDQILTGLGTAAADWETQAAAGSHTITAGASPATWEFKPMGADWRIRIDAGATGPSACIVKVIVIFPSTDFGN